MMVVQWFAVPVDTGALIGHRSRMCSHYDRIYSLGDIAAH